MYNKKNNIKIILLESMELGHPVLVLESFKKQKLLHICWGKLGKMIFKKSFFVLLPFFLQIKLKNTRGGNGIFGNWKNNKKASYLDGHHTRIGIVWNFLSFYHVVLPWKQFWKNSSPIQYLLNPIPLKWVPFFLNLRHGFCSESDDVKGIGCFGWRWVKQSFLETLLWISVF